MFTRARKFRERAKIYGSRDQAQVSIYDTIRGRCESTHVCTRQYDKRADIRWRGYGGLLLLTVRVGGESIDGILLELAVLLTHLRSLVLCVNLTRVRFLDQLNRRPFCLTL